MKIVFKVYINFPIPFIRKNFFCLFCYIRSGKFVSLYNFNLEVPLLEGYIGQLGGARGNSWG